MQETKTHILYIAALTEGSDNIFDTNLANQISRTNVFSCHPFSYHLLDTRLYHIVYMLVPHKHIFKIA